ncbi:MAG TPA: hypothetical protein VG713_20950, partial [Pirellulales bacterium]|nr:hypothetical protein [Pirellulales bacterium]
AAVWNASFEPSPGTAPVGASLDVAAGDAAYMLQADYHHHGQNRFRRAVKIRHGTGTFADLTPEAESSSQPIGSWASVATPAGGVLIAVENLAKLFPKELEIDQQGVTAHLWSSRGGRLLDYRASALVDHWGTDWLDAQYPGGSAAARKFASNAQGSSRTHDLWLCFFAPGETMRAEAFGMLAATPPRCIQDPQWMRRSEALGYVHPYDPKRFGDLERFLEHFVCEYLVGQADRWGDFGFLDYGCGPHYYLNTRKLPGVDRPRAHYRYSGNMYNGQTALWQAYARSGQRMYRDYTEAFHRHNADYKFVHFATKGYPIGAQRCGLVSEETPFYWSGRVTLGSGVIDGHQGRDLEGFFLQHYLTGDRWALETVRQFGETFLRDFDPGVLPNIGANSNIAQPLTSAAALYGNTGDERYRQKLEQIRARCIDLRTLVGWVDNDYYGAWHKFPNSVSAELDDYLVTGADLPRQAFLKAARIWLWHRPESDTGYQDRDGRVCNYAWRQTGDLRYAEYIEERLDRALFEYVALDGTFRDENVVSTVRGGPHQGGTHAFNFLETAYYGMDLLAATEGQRKPYVVADSGVGGHPVEIWLAKEWHEPITLELQTSPQPDLQVRWTPDEKMRPTRDYHDMPIHWQSYPNYFSKSAPGLAGGYARAEIGVETVAGEYRLVNVPLVFATDAKKLVMVARDGITLRGTSATPPTWYFEVPAGKQGAIFVNKPVVLKLDDQPAPCPPGAWLELHGGSSGRKASITASGLVFLNFRGGVPPVLAQHDASRYFVPREIQSEMSQRESNASTARSDEPFVAGLTTASGDQAALLSGKRSLKIARGQRSAAGRYEFIDYSNGALEFWFQPRWTTGSIVGDSTSTFLTGGFWNCSIRHYSGDDEDPKMADNFGFLATASQKPPPGSPAGYPAQDLRNVTPVVAGRWHHFAVCWTTDPKRGWLSELYIDGKPSLGWARHDVGLGRFLEAESAKYRPSMPWPIDEPKGEWITLLGNILDAAVDELRISRSPRYPSPFAAPARRKLDVDDDTLLLLHFDGKADAVVPRRNASPKVELR